MGTHNPTVVRFRHHPARGVAALIVAISTVSLAAVSGWLLLLSLVPLAWAVWIWSAGTDADPDGIRVRALLREVRIPWTAVRHLAPVGPGRVVATLTSGATLALTAVTPTDLPRLAAASGGEVASGEVGPAAPGTP
jgi:hypothetical protein